MASVPSEDGHVDHGALGAFVPSGVDRPYPWVGRPWRRSVQALATLVMGWEAGSRRNPRRNHVLRQILRE